MYSSAILPSTRAEASRSPETHAFMQVRLVESYSDANIAENVQLNAPGAVPSTKKVKKPEDFFIQGLRLSNRENPGFRGTVSRTMSVKTIPKGTLLYSYITIRPPPEGTTVVQMANHMYAKLLDSVVFPCSYDNDTNQYTFTYAKYYPNDSYYCMYRGYYTKRARCGLFERRWFNECSN